MSWLNQLWYGKKAAEVLDAATELAAEPVWEPGEPCQAILRAFKVRRKTFQYSLEHTSQLQGGRTSRLEVLIDTITGRVFEHRVVSTRHGRSDVSWSPSCLTRREVEWLRTELRARYDKVAARARTINGAKQRSVLLREYPA